MKPAGWFGGECAPIYGALPLALRAGAVGMSRVICGRLTPAAEITELLKNFWLIGSFTKK